MVETISSTFWEKRLNNGPKITIETWCIQGIEGVNKIKDGYNPATWMLEVTSAVQEQMLGIDLPKIYKHSELYM